MSRNAMDACIEAVNLREEQNEIAREERSADRMREAAPAMYEALKCANNVLFLLSDEVAALGCKAGGVPGKVVAAIEQAEGKS